MKRLFFITFILIQNITFGITPEKIESNKFLLASWLRKVEDRLEFIDQIEAHADGYQTLLEAHSLHEIASVITLNLATIPFGVSSFLMSLICLSKIPETRDCDKLMSVIGSGLMVTSTAAIFTCLGFINRNSYYIITANKRIIEKLEQIKQRAMNKKTAVQA